MNTPADFEASREALLPRWEVTTRVDPRLAGMAAVFRKEVQIDEAVITQLLPSLELPGTQPLPLTFEARLEEEWMGDIYDVDALSSGVHVATVFSKNDVRWGRDKQKVAVRALREGVNLNNPALQEEASSSKRRFDNLMGSIAMVEVIGVPGAVTYAAVELADTNPDLTTAIGFGVGVASFCANAAIMFRYGARAMQRSELRLAPYQKDAQPVSKDLPPIVSFVSV